MEKNLGTLFGFSGFDEDPENPPPPPVRPPKQEGMGRVCTPRCATYTQWREWASEDYTRWYSA